MLVLNPQRVEIDGQTWTQVESIAVDRLAHRLVQEWGDEGAFATLIDVPEQRVRVMVVQMLDEGAFDAPRPGDQVMLTFEAARSGSDAGRVSVDIELVITEVRHDVSRGRGMRTLSGWGVSSDGATDPVEVSEIGGGA